jgi:hypothetical protein
LAATTAHRVVEGGHVRPVSARRQVGDAGVVDGVLVDGDVPGVQRLQPVELDLVGVQGQQGLGEDPVKGDHSGGRRDRSDLLVDVVADVVGVAGHQVGGPTRAETFDRAVLHLRPVTRQSVPQDQTVADQPLRRACRPTKRGAERCRCVPRDPGDATPQVGSRSS